MREITLQFPTIIQLIDFQTNLHLGAEIQVSRSQLTIIGSFTDSDIKTAELDYKAVILDNMAPKNQLVNLPNENKGSNKG